MMKECPDCGQMYDKNSTNEQGGACPTCSFLAQGADQVITETESRSKLADLLDIVWIAYLISVIGLYVPVIDFQLCSIIGGAILAVALLRFRTKEKRNWKTAGLLCGIEVVLTVIACGVTVLALFLEPISLLNVPVLFCMLICGIAAYWMIMGETASSMNRLGRKDIANGIYSTRIMYLVYTIITISVALIIGVIIGIVLLKSGSRVSRLGVHHFIGLFFLPIHWVFGYFLVLKPISRARSALRASCP